MGYGISQILVISWITVLGSRPQYTPPPNFYGTNPPGHCKGNEVLKTEVGDL